MLETATAWAVSHLDDGDAVLIVDETAGAKSSADCVGAARQYSGTVGGVALCQVAVTVTAREAGRRRGRRAGHPLEVLAPLDCGLPACLRRDSLQREQDAGSGLDAGLIPVTVPELLRLLRDIVIPPPRRDRAHRLHWSAWRRRHQHRARQAHRRWSAYAETATMITTNYSCRI